MKTEVSEKLVSYIWQHQLATNLITDADEQLQVIYPGRTSNGSGCDFRDAVFTIEGKIITGNIEVHVKSSQWYSHGHHKDPKYNDTVLHVAMWHDSQSATLLQNSKTIPTICLNFFLNDSLDAISQRAELSPHSPPTCLHATSLPNPEALGKLLTAAGTERFTAKIGSFRTALNREQPGQMLFRSLSRALGYNQNSEPCEELANRSHLSFLESTELRTDSAKQAWILGTAGLLPSQRPRLQDRLGKNSEIEKLETIWQSSGANETMKESDWSFFRVRPDNFPTRRLVALSYLLTRYRKSGLLQGILKLVRGAPLGTEHRWVEDGMIIISQGYWAHHLDFGIAKKRSSALLGRGRAAEIAINVILPFVCAWSEATAESKLKQKAAKIYHHYPSLGDNELTRHMEQQFLLKSDAKLSACQQQGLIHIFKAYCRHRNCTKCPVALKQS